MSMVRAWKPGHPEGYEKINRLEERDPWARFYNAMESGEILTALLNGISEDGEKLFLDLGNGIVGVIPKEEWGEFPNGKPHVGIHVSFVVEAVDRDAMKVYVSRRKAREHQAEATLPTLTEGARVLASVQWIGRQGAVLDLGGVYGWLPAHEISWSERAKPDEALSLDEAIDVVVLGPDKVYPFQVSRRLLMGDPWQKADEKWPVGSRQFGVVRKVAEGVDGKPLHFVEISEGVTILGRLRDPEAKVARGDKVVVRITGMDPEKRRGRGVILWIEGN